ncbi:photosystem II Pbs27-domain-containing protein [Haematococcus lacustris]
MKLQSTSLRAGQKGAVGPHLRSVPRSSLAAASHRQAGEAPALGQISRREALNATALLLTGLAVSVASPAQAFLGIGEDNSAAIQTSYDSRTAGILSLVQSTLDVPKDDPSKEDKVKELRKEINGWVADFRREPKVAGRPSYGQTYSVLNALAGHYNSFGATAPIPKKRMERITKELADATLFLSRGR